MSVYLMILVTKSLICNIFLVSMSQTSLGEGYREEKIMYFKK